MDSHSAPAMAGCDLKVTALKGENRGKTIRINMARH